MTKFEDVDVIAYLGNDEYHAIFISLNDETGRYNVYQPNCRFNKEDVVEAFNITADKNITMYINEFDTLESALRYVSDRSLGVENIKNIDVFNAVKLINEQVDSLVAYSKIQVI